MFLQKIREFIREEALYCVLLSAVMLFHASSSIYVSFHPIPPGPPPSESALGRAQRILSAEPQKLQELLEKDSSLQFLGSGLTLLAVVVLLIGVLLLFQFWMKQKRGEWEYRFRLLPPRPAWGILVNRNGDQLLNHPWVITRDEVAWKSFLHHRGWWSRVWWGS